MALVDIPVSRSVRQFIYRKFSHNLASVDGEPVLRFNKKFFLAKLLSNFHQAVNPEDDPRILTYQGAHRGHAGRCHGERGPGGKKLAKPVYITFEVNASHKPAAFMLSAENEERIAWLLDQFFKQEFCTYVDVATSFGIKVYPAIRKFMETMDLSEDDCSFDFLVRHYSRHTKRDNPLRDAA